MHTVQCPVLCVGAMYAVAQVHIMWISRTRSFHNTAVYTSVAECTHHEDIQYGANDPIVAGSQEIKFDEFEYDVTSVRRNCMPMPNISW